MSKKIIALGGLTACGKTAISLKLGQKFPIEIINADSRQIYQEIDIGTAKLKVDNGIYADIPHHLIDKFSPKDPCNLAKYQKLAYQKIKQIWGRKRIPMLVGGTGLYIDAVIHRYDLQEKSFDPTQRKQLQKLTLKQLQQKLTRLSSNTFKSMTPSDQKNKHRLIRKIEKLESPSKPLSQTSSKSPSIKKFDYLYLVLKIPHQKLIANIDTRVKKMFEKGLLQENKALRKKGYSTDMLALQTIGYQEFDDFFSGEKTLDEIKERIKINTRQYAKRQETWFKRNDDITWISNYNQAENLVSNFVGSI